jgi:hypothetical protein
MPEFLRLPFKEQAEIFAALSAKTGRTAQMLQKDVWLCWALEKLFAAPSKIRMVFKGGSSLSKVFDAIHRFSEDVDVTLDYRDLCPDEDPLDEEISNTQKRKIGDKLKALVQAHIHEVVKPHLEKALAETTGGRGTVAASENGEEVWLYYPSELVTGAGYMKDEILIEFGGRNATEPNGPYEIKPYIAQHVMGLDLPLVKVAVLSPERTFWEKATLIHVECHRERAHDADRISRHWYDLVMLFSNPIGQTALEDRALLADVVRHKKVFFNAAYANYDACLAGKFRLVPDEPLLAGLGKDFEAMVTSGMFDQTPPSFAEIIETLKGLEKRINGWAPGAVA